MQPEESEIERARQRKELGNPPGKKADPLGDQITWEQILIEAQTKKSIWIITRDTDFATNHSGKMFLNTALHKELSNQDSIEVFCFNDTIEGIKHFIETTKVRAEHLPTPDEQELIKEENDSLPPLDWPSGITAGLTPSAYTWHRGNTDVTPGSALLNVVGMYPRKKPDEE